TAGALVVVPGSVATSFASEIRYTVNGQSITSYDIQRRAAFLKIQGAKGGEKAAVDEMVDQTIKLQEGAKAGIRISTAEVDAAFARFAASNKMSPKQMGDVLNQVGVTPKHFKEYIRSQMTWGQVQQLKQRSASGGDASMQDVVANMLAKGGTKPTSTEYILQQVIFVVPAAERGKKLGQRKKEAEAMRARYQSCDTTYDFAKGLMDVTVRDLGRILEAELPTDWKDQIIATKAGGATPVRTTDRGAEFIAVCRSRAVSDDKVAELQFRIDSVKNAGTEDDSALVELRKKAQIIKR
ncbi:MAG: SurA N-terminal domain-containing protein, partial [Notoacmeibacter sp.]